MKRRKFIKYSSFASIGASLFPMSIVEGLGKQSASHLIQLSAASTQIRHGALNLPFAEFLKSELPFDWLVDVQQNIFFKDGFQRNEAEDMNVISIALKEKENFEALQVSIKGNEISLLWKDQYVSLNQMKTIQDLPFEDDTYTFQLVKLHTDQSIEFDQDPKRSYFIQVLDGEVLNGSNLLNSTNGLGIISESKPLALNARVNSSVLIISRLQGI